MPILLPVVLMLMLVMLVVALALMLALVMLSVVLWAVPARLGMIVAGPACACARFGVARPLRFL